MDADAQSGASPGGKDGVAGVDPRAVLPRAWVLALGASVVGAGLGLRFSDAAPAWLWLACAISSASVALMVRTPGAARGLCVALAMGLAIAGRGASLESSAAHDSVSRYVGEAAQLASVRGAIDGPVRTTGQRAPVDMEGLARYAYTPPGVTAEMRVEYVRVDGVWTRASGRLRVRLLEPDHRLRRGLRIEADGWLGALAPPANPGEIDRQVRGRRQGIEGVLRVPGRGNWRALGEPAWGSLDFWMARKDAFSSAVRESLWRGLAADDPRRGVSAALLVGDRSGLSSQTYAEFRAAGLAHALSLSGAHLGIVLGLGWLLARVVFDRPRKAAVAAAAVMALFLLSAEIRTPLVRAAAMGTAGLLAAGVGRPGSAMRAMAISAIALLAWDPRQVADPGFQLSYVAVGAILMLAGPLSRRLWRSPAWSPDPGAPTSTASGPAWVGWLIVQWFAVSVAAFAASAPLVAHHFGMANSWGAPVSLVAVVPLTLVLGVGYAKALIGLVFPSVSELLAPALRVSLDALTGLAREASSWPGAGLELGAAPSMPWALGCTAVVVALLGGGFARRRLRGGLCVGMLAGWAVIGAGAWGTAAWAPAGDDGRFRFDAKADALAWTALSVGDGSAHLLRSGDSAALVDCGSGGWPRMGSAALVPALRAMGVRRLDWALVTHGDLDHFVGLLDVLAEVDIGVVFVGADVLEQARASPGGPEAALLAGLEARGVAAEEVVAGWETTLGEARVVCLWPSASPEERAGLAPGNDRSAVLRIEVAGRAVLLAGDVQRDAMEALLDRGASLQADAAAIPHHGGYEQGVSERWVQAVGAEVWVQSSSRRRQRDAVWDPLMRAMGAVRYATARDGAVMVGIDRSGELRVVRYRDDGRPRGRSDADGLAHPGDGL